jgi:hypothetical protein
MKNVLMPAAIHLFFPNEFIMSLIPYYPDEFIISLLPYYPDEFIRSSFHDEFIMPLTCGKET